MHFMKSVCLYKSPCKKKLNEWITFWQPIIQLIKQSGYKHVFSSFGIYKKINFQIIYEVIFVHLKGISYTPTW